MKTPWGEIEELRELRLTPGRGSPGPAAWVRLKRRRFLAAMVAGLAEKSYADLTIDDLERLSGCGREEFYRVFRSKEDCLLQAVEALYDHALGRTTLAYVNTPGDWQRRMRAAFGEVVGVLAAQPDAARMAVVEVYAAGEPGSRGVERALGRFERLLGGAYAEAGRAELPAAVIGAEVAGIQMFLHDLLHRGREAELATAADGLLAWALSYEAGTEPLRRPRPRPKPLEMKEGPEPVERILRAVADICATEGVSALTAQKIAPRARVSLATLYKYFRGAEPAFLACFIAIRDRALELGWAAFEGEAEWPTAARAAIAAIFDYLAVEPAFARVATVEVLGAGPRALAARDLAVGPFVDLVRPGFERAPDASPLAAELSAFAIYSLAGRHIARHGAGGLPALLPTATFLGLAPFLGSEEATRVANGGAGSR